MSNYREIVTKAIIGKGRKTFTNLLKYIKMATSGNFGNMISVIIASILSTLTIGGKALGKKYAIKKCMFLEIMEYVKFANQKMLI